MYRGKVFYFAEDGESMLNTEIFEVDSMHRAYDVAICNAFFFMDRGGFVQISRVDMPEVQPALIAFGNGKVAVMSGRKPYNALIVRSVTGNCRTLTDLL